MAITKRLKVSFDVTCVVDNEMLTMMDECILDTARALKAGEKVDPIHREILVQALTGGVEAAVAFVLKAGIREFIRSAHKDLCHDERKLMKISPTTIREVK
ncbi:HNS binding protein [Salmonella phage JSS2]|uniref:HNS binding protein n=1 Tax=Salmonella phage JSS2 TaxID=2972749 RepID=A0AAE9SY41_9CAUD|nr:HNS binding protein [Salmonella phage JSS2]